jgi:selenocysteine lyase/cysteine desulfurase
MSPHFYNRQDELDRALDAVSEILAARPPVAGHPATV